MTLNRAQRIMLGLGGCLLLVMFLLPPWIESRGRGENLGYGFLFTPPGYFPTIDLARLFLQIAATVTGITLLMWWFHSQKAIVQSSPEKTSERSIMQKVWDVSFKLPRFEADQWLGGRRRFLWLVALCLVLLALFRAIHSKSSIMRDPLEGATAVESDPPR